jgi:GNAT superfamily N-acetyltransferase
MDGIRTVPATPDRWEDLLTLFGPNGAYSNCWCTWWILRAKEWDQAAPEERRGILADLVASGTEPGILAYAGDEPVGWCAVGPRERYARMMSPRSPTYRPLDDEPSWIINCFYVAKGHRRRGVSRALLDAAVEHAFANSATRIDAYPIDPDRQKASSTSSFVGTLPMFLEAGFTEITRMRNRPVVRLIP